MLIKLTNYITETNHNTFKFLIMIPNIHADNRLNFINDESILLKKKFIIYICI